MAVGGERESRHLADNIVIHGLIICYNEHGHVVNHFFLPGVNIEVINDMAVEEKYNSNGADKDQRVKKWRP